MTELQRPLSRRELMTVDIVEQVRAAVQEELYDAPKLTKDDRAAIEDELLCYTTLILDALSSEEMGSERALTAHIANARFEANRLIRSR